MAQSKQELLLEIQKLDDEVRHHIINLDAEAARNALYRKDALVRKLHRLQRKEEAGR